MKVGEPRAYYNEYDPFAAAWLRNLAERGLIQGGTVDDRSIVDVRGSDLAGYTRVHFFAGIGGWDYALNLAGWPADVPVWTGSCPCQPFSCAGKRQGEKDERHLWPEFYRLVRECRPAIVFGEQVASKDGLRWLDGVFTDLEGAGYACGACDTCAAGVGAPHIRQRLYWVAYASSVRQQRLREIAGTNGEGDGRPEVPQRWASVEPAGSREAGIAWDRSDEFVLGYIDGLADAGIPASERRTGGLPETQAGICGARPQHGDMPDRFADGGKTDRLGDPSRERLERSGDHARAGCAGPVEAPVADCGVGVADSPGPQPGRESAEAAGYGRSAEPAGCWSDFLLAPCRDNKVRRISAEPGDVPLAHGIPRDVGRVFPRLAGMARGARRNRVGRLKGYGNAINPYVAAEFIRAFMEMKVGTLQQAGWEDTCKSTPSAPTAANRSAASC